MTMNLNGHYSTWETSAVFMFEMMRQKSQFKNLSRVGLCNFSTCNFLPIKKLVANFCLQALLSWFIKWTFVNVNTSSNNYIQYWKKNFAPLCVFKRWFIKWTISWTTIKIANSTPEKVDSRLSDGEINFFVRWISNWFFWLEFL